MNKVKEERNSLRTELDESNKKNKSLTQELREAFNATKLSNEELITPNQNQPERKRKKAVSPSVLDSTNIILSQNSTADDLNDAALYLSTCDEDEIAATPMATVTNIKLNSSADRSRLHRKSPSSSRLNKENRREANISPRKQANKSPSKPSDSPLKQISNNVHRNFELGAADETSDEFFLSTQLNLDTETPVIITSPTMLTRLHSKVKHGWKSTAHRKAKSTATSPFAKRVEDSPTRSVKKQGLSLSRPATRLKQPTLNFSKSNQVSRTKPKERNFPKLPNLFCQSDETYCEGFTSVFSDSTFAKADPSAIRKVKIETRDDTGVKTLSRSLFPAEPKVPSTSNDIQPTPSSSDSVLAVPTETEDIIILEESQSSEELFNNIVGIKDAHESSSDGEVAPVQEDTPVEKVPNVRKKPERPARAQRPQRQQWVFECAECEGVSIYYLFFNA